MLNHWKPYYYQPADDVLGAACADACLAGTRLEQQCDTVSVGTVTWSVCQVIGYMMSHRATSSSFLVLEYWRHVSAVRAAMMLSLCVVDGAKTCLKKNSF